MCGDEETTIRCEACKDSLLEQFRVYTEANSTRLTSSNESSWSPPRVEKYFMDVPDKFFCLAAT
jgi:hypothetical protein